MACSRTRKRVSADTARLLSTRGAGRSRGGGRSSRALPSAFPEHQRNVFCWLRPLGAEKVRVQPPFGRRAVSSARSPWAMTASPYVLATRGGVKGGECDTCSHNRGVARSHPPAQRRRNEVDGAVLPVRGQVGAWGRCSKTPLRAGGAWSNGRSRARCRIATRTAALSLDRRFHHAAEVRSHCRAASERVLA